jgi:epoxyqueuosine reductase QueG
MPPGLTADPAAWITDWLARQVAESPDNRLDPGGEEPAWEAPLVGFAPGDDPLWRRCKEHIGEFFWLPEEAFALAVPKEPAPAAELAVISWVLPQTEATRRENREQKAYPSRRWAAAKARGEAFNNLLRRRLADTLKVQGVLAAAPLLLPEWGWRDSQRWVYASNWSERHAAHIAGLGTFGLCDGLITPKGKAVRAGSVVARLAVPPTPRPYGDHHAYCLFYSHGTCGKCIARCPVNALSEAGHHKRRCREHVLERCARRVERDYGFATDACGLCQTGVPCEDHIPGPEEG